MSQFLYTRYASSCSVVIRIQLELFFECNGVFDWPIFEILSANGVNQQNNPDCRD